MNRLSFCIGMLVCVVSLPACGAGELPHCVEWPNVADISCTADLACGINGMKAKCRGPVINCGSGTSSLYGTVTDWVATCNGVKLLGVGACSHTMLEITEVLPAYEGDGTGRAYCHCKIIAPFETKWITVNINSGMDLHQCHINCGGVCANIVKGAASEYKYKLFNPGNLMPGGFYI